MRPNVFAGLQVGGDPGGRSDAEPRSETLSEPPPPQAVREHGGERHCGQGETGAREAGIERVVLSVNCALHRAGGAGELGLGHHAGR